VKQCFIDIFANAVKESVFPTLGQANRAKDVFQKFVDSVLQKSAKIRSLVGELQRVYPDDSTAQKSLSKMIWIQMVQ
jgi:hypothetical protein